MYWTGDLGQPKRSFFIGKPAGIVYFKPNDEY